MTDRYRHEYINCEISEIIDNETNESLPAEELTDRLNCYHKQLERAKILRKACQKNWESVINIIREEIENTDNQEIKKFLTELLHKELPEW